MATKTKSQKGTRQTPNGGADSIFMTSNSLAAETRECKILFIAPTSSKDKLRLIVTRDNGKTRDVVYVFKEVVSAAGVKPGMKAVLFVEQRHDMSRNQDFWNCTAIAPME